MANRTYKNENVWYPLYEQVLVQTIHDCDVTDSYSGFIYNPALNRRKFIEDRQQAEAECKKRNALIDYVEVL